MQPDVFTEQSIAKFTSHMEFGECANTTPIYFAKIRELDGKIIMVPYSSPKDKLSTLISSYLLTSPSIKYN
jgi:hypothetical protein